MRRKDTIFPSKTYKITPETCMSERYIRTFTKYICMK